MIEKLNIPDKSTGDRLYAEEVDAIVNKVNEIAEKVEEGITFSDEEFEI